MADKIGNFKLDARPDRLDIRDREYRPPLRSLPERYPSQEIITTYLPHYKEDLILDQGSEGACTGFGLAAVINYLFWTAELAQLLSNHPAGKVRVSKIACVSPSMLYRMARVYDEWPGEDYEGSSCRGAIKGWHRHGVCSDDHWPYRTKGGQIRYIKPKSGWEDNAASRPLGAYYRINKNSILDMQAAIYEVGAIYVSAEVNEAWMDVYSDKDAPIIDSPANPKDTGGHAFAIVGYTMDGFIVQNSWGPGWGFHGFAVMTYADWVDYGTDAWVAVMGAPVHAAASRTMVTTSLEAQASGQASWSWRPNSIGKKVAARSETEPWEECKAYEHTVVLENDGRPISRFLDLRSGEDAVKEVAETLPRRWLAGKKTPAIAIYAHGGLNHEDASLKRIRVMAPYFSANEVYPLFATWRTGFLESIRGILGDAVGRFFEPTREELARGLFSDALHQIREARDRSIEVASENLLVKAVWVQMKQNAMAAAASRTIASEEPAKADLSASYRVTQPGLVLLADHLRSLKAAIPKLKIHLIGHSAGSILLGHLLDLLRKPEVEVASVSLYAPACTVAFANKHYVPAVGKIVAKGDLHVDLLSDEREHADTVGLYCKSLLYLVSRALEERHKTPLLGMETAWKGPNPEWPSDFDADLTKWNRFAGQSVKLITHSREKVRVAPNQTIDLAHGSFDNDTEVVARTLAMIRGEELQAPVTSLTGF